FHYEQKALVTMTAVRPAGRFGELGLDGLTVQSFNEKPEQESGFINGGYMVLDKSVRAHLNGDDCVFERAPLQKLAETGLLKAYCHDGFWQCMDTYREFEMLNKMWDSGNAPWKIW
ncbi:MAG: glucose-1-phosphate cytidylyltransferase, partial [Prosthecobacter sp.]|nr:glucose-1-phosphate cytidylyltransferase [Prosthecobacter sp.]